MNATTKAELVTDLLPEPLEYGVLEGPPADEPRPVILALHGGGGDRSFLDGLVPHFTESWAEKVLPPAVVVTPTAHRSFYMDYRDGSQRWESAIVGPLLDEVQARFGAGGPDTATVVLGISMGGMGGLRIAFKHPEVFAGVAALEPGIEPVLEFADIALEDRFWRSDELFGQIYGNPVDQTYWRANNPASLVVDDPDRLRGSNLGIYIECGDRDSFGLHRGTEFLHRTLYDHGISHEYRLVRGADHLGVTLPGRFRDALRFLGTVLAPPAPDETLGPLHTMISTWKAQAGLS